MMDLDTLNAVREEATQALSRFQLSDALACLLALTSECDNQQLSHQAHTLQQNYDSMLSFLSHGGNDDNRQQIQIQLARNIYYTLQATHRCWRINDGRDIYATTYHHLQKNAPQPLSADALFTLWKEVKDTTRRFEIQDSFFDYLWTSPTFIPKDTALWFEFIDSQDVDFQRYLLSALFLSSWEYFDEEKWVLLRLFLDSETEAIRAQGVCAYALLSKKYTSLLSFLPELNKDIPERAVSELEEFLRNSFIIPQSISIQKKMEKEAIYQLLKSDVDASQSSSDEEEESQDKHIRQLNRWRKDCVDFHAHSMAIGRKDFFFQRVCHWMAPFDIERPECTVSNTEKKNAGSTLLSSSVIRQMFECDNDQYAFSFLIQHNEKMFPQQVQDQLLEHFGGTDVHRIPYSPHTCWLRNLFRLTCLSPWSQEFADPFSPFPELIHLPQIESHLTAQGKIRFAKLLMRYCEHAQALPLIKDVTHDLGATAELLKMEATCHLKCGNDSAAIYAFTQASILDDSDEEILSSLQTCLNRTQNYEQQEQVLLKLIRLNPDKTSYIKELALCYYRQDNFEKALQYFFEMEYKLPGDFFTLRYIIRCYWESDRMDNAWKYADKLISLPGEKAFNDYLLAGHIAFIRGEWHRAVSLYREYVGVYLKEHEKDSSDPSFYYLNDWNKLSQRGISLQDFALMRDTFLHSPT